MNTLKAIAICALVMSILISGCAPGQTFGPTLTPSPTSTPAPPTEINSAVGANFIPTSNDVPTVRPTEKPTSTPTKTASPTPASSPTPEASATPLPESPAIKVVRLEFEKYKFSTEGIVFTQTGTTVTGVDEKGVIVYEKIEGDHGNFELHFVVNHLDPNDLWRTNNKPDSNFHNPDMLFFKSILDKNNNKDFFNKLLPPESGKKLAAGVMLIHEFKDEKGGWSWALLPLVGRVPISDETLREDFVYENAKEELVDIPIIGVTAGDYMNYY